MAFSCEWPYKCDNCGETHSRGALTHYNSDNRLEAVDCAQAEIEETNITAYKPVVEEVTSVCTSCFVVHATGQKGCYE